MVRIALTLPDDLVARFKLAVPAGQRSAYLRKLIERSLPKYSGEDLYRIALAANADLGHDDEWPDWEEGV